MSLREYIFECEVLYLLHNKLFAKAFFCNREIFTNGGVPIVVRGLSDSGFNVGVPHFLETRYIDIVDGGICFNHLSVTDRTVVCIKPGVDVAHAQLPILISE